MKPPKLYINLLVLFSMSVLFGAGCEKEDITLAPTKPEPMIILFDPAKGIIGQDVTIHGNHFIPPFEVGTFLFGPPQSTNTNVLSSNITLEFNGIPAAVDRISQDGPDQQSITTKVPVGASSGRITVMSFGNAWLSPSDFIVLNPQFPAGAKPIIDGFSPKTTIIGLSVSVYGNHFMPPIPVGIHIEGFEGTEIAFNGTKAIISSINQDDLNRQRIMTVVPEGTSSGKITVSANGSTAISEDDFHVSEPIYQPNVLVSTVSRYSGPDVAIDIDGNFYITTGDYYEILKITPNDDRTVIFSSLEPDYEIPLGISVVKEKNIYATVGHRIIKIVEDGSVQNIAGHVENGNVDGNGSEARFNLPFDIDLDTFGNIYVADLQNHKIRKIDKEGNVNTLAGSLRGFLDGPTSVALFDSPIDVAVDLAGNVFVADAGNAKIRKITPLGQVSTVAGREPGHKDGTIAEALFYGPRAVSVDVKGNLYISDGFTVRMISTDGMVTTLAGSTFGNVDGPGQNARFGQTLGNTLDSDGALYLTQGGGLGGIRKIVIQ